MKKLFLIFLLLISIKHLNIYSSQLVQSDNDYKIDVFNPLEPTPNALLVDNISKPSVFHKNNNLTRPTGSFKISIGEPLFIVGKVIDSFKIPIEGVVIKIWHTNAAGYYQTLIKKNSDFYDLNFLTSGQAVTDNMGNYNFVTIFPGFYDDRAPHINIIISHKKFGTIETEIYFKNHPKNSSDAIYLKYSDKEKKMLTATVNYVDSFDIKKGKVAIFNITMEGIHQYKKF